MGRPKNSGSETSGRTAKKLIEVAIDLFSSKGFKGTSIRDIARETGLTTSAIYHNFGTKGGLLAAIGTQTIEPLLQELRRVYALDLPPVDRFKLLLRTHLTFIGTHRKESKIFFVGGETLPLGERDLDKRRQREIFFMYRAEIARLMSSMGRKGNAAVATFCTFGTMMWFLTWYRPEGRFSMEDVINDIIEYILHGILGYRTLDNKVHDSV
jgi:TetR/AcrR family transcriptional regulator, cholesterol catabolism regulator